MTGLDPRLELLLALLVGVVVAAALTWAIGTVRGQRRLVRAAERLSAAEAGAEAERSRRRELEGELAEARTAARELERLSTVAAERRDQAERLVEEQKAFLERARNDLEDTFQALAGAALKGTSDQFLALAEQRLAAARARATADLDERRQAIESLVTPLNDSLKRLDGRTRELEQARVEAYSRLGEQLQQLARATTELETRTTSLATALKGSQVRGRWGEIALRNIAELSGMSLHCDFEEQATLETGGRPDMTVHLPGDRKIAVDAKAPLTGYLDAMQASQEQAREAALARHVRDLRSHVRQLAARDYAEALAGEIDMVVMFLPGDAFLGAAFAKEPDLQVEALRSKVLIATPTTLVALLRTVAIYWQQQALAENAAAIADTARELYERAAKFGGDLTEVGRGLRGAAEAYNRAVGSFNRRLIPMSRRLEEMKVAEGTKRKLTEPDEVTEEFRAPRNSEP